MVKIVLPLPNRKLHPNGRPHWAERARLVKKARKDAEYAATSAARSAELQEPYTAATVQSVIYRKRNYRADGDGALSWLKSYYDGLQDAKIIVNDTGFQHLPVRFEKDADERVEITIRPLPER